MRRQHRVRGDLERRRRKAQRRAASRGEQHDHRPRRRQRRRRHRVVARRLQKAQAAFPHALAVAQHAVERAGPALLHRAERLFLQRGQPARLVARRRVLEHRLLMLDEVGLEIVDDVDDALKRRLVPGARHQDALGAENFRDFAQDRLAAREGHLVRHAPDHRIGGQAGKGVRTAALHPDHEVRHIARLAPVVLDDRDQLFQRIHARLKLVIDLLRGEPGQPVLRPVDAFDQLRQLVVLAAQPDDQRRPGVRMRGQRGQHVARMAEVVAKLRAAERMGDGVNPVDPALETLMRLLRQPLRRARHAADRAENPDFVADADAAPGTPPAAAIALKRPRGALAARGRVRRIYIVLQPLQRGAQIVAVDVLARRDIGAGRPDAEAVLADRLARRDGNQRELVPPRHVVAQRQRDAARAHALARLQILQRHRHLIAGGDAHGMVAAGP